MLLVNKRTQHELWNACSFPYLKLSSTDWPKVLNGNVAKEINHEKINDQFEFVTIS